MNETANEALLLRQLVVYRKGIRAINGLEFGLTSNSCTAVVGANGSGKSTLLQMLAGILPFEGELWLHGKAVRFQNPAQALRAGVAFCPAERGIFHRLTVEENLRVGGHLLSSPKELAQRVVEQLARFPGLEKRQHVVAGQLSGGERQQLAIARALIMHPRILLLDEPSRGLSPVAIANLLETLHNLTAEGVTVLLADQAIDWLYGYVKRLLILAEGRIVADSEKEDCLMDQLVQRYFDLAVDTAAS